MLHTMNALNEQGEELRNATNAEEVREKTENEKAIIRNLGTAIHVW